MPSYPKTGQEWSQLWAIIGKLASNDELDADDRRWLTELLQDSASGVDVSKRFTQRKRTSPMADRNFWIACDAEWHRRHHAGDDNAILDRWPGLAGENLQKIKRKYRDDVGDISSQLSSPHFVRVVDWHRPASKTGTNFEK